MDHPVATASRNLFRISYRKYRHLALRATQKFLGDGSTIEADSFVLYPAFEPGDAPEMADVLNRLAWYLPDNVLRDDVDVTLGALAGTMENALAGVEQLDSQPSYDVDVDRLRRVPPAGLRTELRKTDCVLVWNYRALLNAEVLPEIGRVAIVDPGYYSTTEVDTWEKVVSAATRQLDDDSARTFSRLQAKAESCSRSVVFATGPSLQKAHEMTFPDDCLTVVCNSIVKNDDLVQHIDPDVLAFADPVFHFGPSRYADRFRRDAVRVLRSYDTTAVVPPAYQALLSGRYSDVALVGMPRTKSETHFPDETDLGVWGTGNIMTSAMLPIASALTDEVYVVGADGRAEDSSYFWDHDDEAQYDDDLMNAAAECHPSFFRDRVYTDYYDEHVSSLTEMIREGERQGVRYRSLTDSHVPCLAERRMEPGEALG